MAKQSITSTRKQLPNQTIIQDNIRPRFNKYPAVCTVRTNKTFYSFLDVNRFDRELELVV